MENKVIDPRRCNRNRQQLVLHRTFGLVRCTLQTSSFCQRTKKTLLRRFRTSCAVCVTHPFSTNNLGLTQFQNYTDSFYTLLYIIYTPYNIYHKPASFLFQFIYIQINNECAHFILSSRHSTLQSHFHQFIYTYILTLKHARVR